MIYWILSWLLTATAFLITSYFVKGFKVSDFGTALVIAVVVGILNIVLRPVLLILTLPINFLTLGLFTFVVNAIVLKVAAYFVKGFEIDGWGSAIIGAIILAIVHTVVFMMFSPPPMQMGNI
jgi:putative membrane protein